MRSILVMAKAEITYKTPYTRRSLTRLMHNIPFTTFFVESFRLHKFKTVDIKCKNRLIEGPRKRASSFNF